MSNIKLKPCPICKGTDLCSWVWDFHETQVIRKNCGFKVCGAYEEQGKKSAYDFWNELEQEG